MTLKPQSAKKKVSLQVDDDSAAKKILPRKIQYAPVMISEQDGIRYLHFGTAWIQGAMRLCKPDWIALEYGRQMMAWSLFIPNPGHIVQLGLGTGALTKFCYRHYPQARLFAIELNPDVITVCQSMFALPPPDERLHVFEMNALDYVQDSHHFNTVDVLHIDLYDATDHGPVLDTPEFYAACAQCLTTQGIMTVNLFGDHPSYEKNISAIRQSFEKVVPLTHTKEGNVVAVAFKTKPVFDANAAVETAKQIKEKTGLTASKWVKDFEKALMD